MSSADLTDAYLESVLNLTKLFKKTFSQKKNYFSKNSSENMDIQVKVMKQQLKMVTFYQLIELVENNQINIQQWINQLFY